LVIALALTGLSVLPAEAAPRPLRSEGDCVQVAAFVPVDASRARAYVPDGFAIVGEEAGAAFVLVTGGRCDAWTIDGRRVAPLRFGLVSILAHPEEDPPGLDGYDLWWLVGDRPTWSGFRRVGVDARLVRGVRFEAEPGPLGEPSAASVDVPWPVSPFSVSAVVAPAGNPPAAFASGHWFEGRFGRVHGVHDNTEAVVVPALVEIDVREGTPVAELLGAASVTIPGGILRFHHEAVTRVVAPG
jgi:hypothetical protein